MGSRNLTGDDEEDDERGTPRAWTTMNAHDGENRVRGRRRTRADTEGTTWTTNNARASLEE